MSGSGGDGDRTPGSRLLVLVRHAKATSHAAGSDHERPLTKGGRADAATVGAWLRRRLGTVDETWCSSAVRARQTLETIAAVLADGPPADDRDEIYDAGPDDLLDMVRDAAATTRTLLVVGHNPTVERLQAWLTGDDRGFPAGAAAVVELGCPWGDVQPGAGRLVDFVVP
jgi:phosphohistidine phosphatase